jgi:hypothetical protein
MIKRFLIAAITILILFTGQQGSITSAEVNVGTYVYPPDTLRIPATISLLAETPYFTNPSITDIQPLGTFLEHAEVSVIAGAYSWSRGKSWWKVASPDGPVWISPDPWNVVIPPPEKVMLFEDTPIYAIKDDSINPTTILPAQELQVTGADKMWFYTNDPNEKRWIRIHTDTFGEQWVHLPVKRIGYIKPVDYLVYYSNQTLLNDPNYEGPLGSKAGPLFKSVINQTVHVTGEYVTVYNTSYQVETDQGLKYVLEKGRNVVRTNEKVTLTSDTPLFIYPNQQVAWMTVLQPQTLDAFEKFENSTVYHVHTELYDGWINTAYFEPAELIKTDYDIELNGPHELYRFPNNWFQITGASIDDRKVQPTGYWKDAEGTEWYLLETKIGKAWFQMNYAKDRVHPNDGTPTMQVTFKETILDTVNVKGKDLLVSGTTIGYMKDESPYLSLDYLTKRFGYELVAEDQSNIVAHSKQTPGYSFRLNPLNGEVRTYWNDQAEENFTLQEAPMILDGYIWLKGDDAQRIFGISIDWWTNDFQNFYLFSDEYQVHLPTLPTAVTSHSLNMIANRFQRTVGQNDAKPKELLQLNVRNHSGSQEINWISKETDLGRRSSYNFFQQSGTIPLLQGTNSITVEFKIGARILARQYFNVSANTVN